MADVPDRTLTLTDHTTGKPIRLPFRRFTAEALETFTLEQALTAEATIEHIGALRREAEAEATAKDTATAMRTLARQMAARRLASAAHMVRQIIDTVALDTLPHEQRAWIMEDADGSEFWRHQDIGECEDALARFRRVLGL